MKSLLNIVGWILMLAGNGGAQVSLLEPGQPRWEQTLTITYNAAARGAKFTAEEDVYVCAKLTFPDHGENVSARMTKSGTKFSFKLEVKENLAAIAVHFITMSGGWDEQAYTTAIVFRPDGQAARGAYASKIQSGRYQDFFKQEIALYPDNYSAYRAKWAMAALIEEGKASGTINAEIKRLGRAPETAELLYALSHGHLLLRRGDKSRELIRQLASKFPSSSFTAKAINEYEEQLASQPASNDGRAEVAKLKLEVINANPSGDFARWASTVMARDPRARPDVIEKVTSLWMKAEPENPQPYFNLAMAYLNQYQKYGQAVPMIERAIELLLAGKLRLYGDINGKQTEAMLPESYLISADLLFRQQQYAEALTAANTAQAFARDSDFAAYLLDAKILKAIGRNAESEAAFIEAWRRGSPEAEERLKDVYLDRQGSLNGFDEYLIGATKGKNGNATSISWKQAAPSFKLTLLDGKRFDLNALAGKIIILNLWFIECGPCRKEIPKLNELVAEFSGKPVVFLAPSFDSAEALRSFLKTTPFKYQIVPNAEAVISGQFNAATFPTHIVINQNGLIEATLIGATERRPEEVRRLILRLLNAQASQ
ncbi:MAG: redoxin domain-containing protein [Acidobacteriota bacterium]|nr:redoxin domain-containing protein [Acidobacteriota bacterium]